MENHRTCILEFDIVMKEKRKETQDEIILAYRKIIEKRYDFAELKKRADLPDSFTEERVNKFKAYFLNYVYPTPDRRDELNEAFESLDNYIKHPEKLLRLLMDSASLLFKYGRHLPKILKAGIKALQAFRKANKFERQLVNRALALKLEAPFSQTDIETLIGKLSRAEIEEFIESGQQLFETLHDRTLVAKIQEVVSSLIEKMKKRPNSYSPTEIRGLEMGQEIIREGDLLFDQLGTDEQQLVFDYTIQLEREMLDKMFND